MSSEQQEQQRDEQHTHAAESAWRRFWNRGGWWKALLLAAVYWGLYQLAGLLLSFPFGHLVDTHDVFANGLSTFFGIGAPILVGGILLVAFALSLGWLKQLFGPQPIRGSWWMWIGVGIVVVFNILRFVSADYSAWDAGAVVAVLITGLCIGFAEEVLTRGFAVNLLRRAGYGERSVMLLSSLIFAALHAGNALTGQNLFAVAFTVVYTFAFGLVMYAALRVTGNLIWPILLHASTDPSLFLLTGGVDASSGTMHLGPLAGIAGLANWAVMLFALVPLIFVRGRVDRDAAYGLKAPAAPLS
ncbi:CPBP family intramembrane glutamic endopeptidase [Leifsonia sp. NPDC058194]|uniref:CPBP family intramembrane glutamic endopeptidase n=1 Tax=Leifsonia sp. NPDC058194 TaxID=3346374 RepID=UPI0036D9E52C